MKKQVLSLLALLLVFFTAFSQTSDHIKGTALGIHYFFNDFKTASAIRASSLNSVLVNKQISKIKDMIPGLGISYVKGLSSHLDFAGTLGGSFLDYEVEGRSPLGSGALLLEADASVNAKMFTDNYWVVPYLSAGIGLSKYKGYYGAFIPLGAGIQINFFDEAYFVINSQYRVKVTDNTSYHFYSSVGIVGNIGARKGE